MTWPWAVSLVAQAALVLALAWRGRRDWTWWYLVYSLCRSGALWATPRTSYWLVWLATEPPSIALLLMASLERVDALFSGVWIDGRIRAWVQRAAALLLIAGCGWLVLTGWQWPAVRRGVYLLREAGTFACLSILLVGWALGWLIQRPLRAGWLTAYLAMHAAMAAARLMLGPDSMKKLNAAGLVAAAALFTGWTALLLRRTVVGEAIGERLVSGDRDGAQGRQNQYTK